jgi:hypothetical protein
MFLSGLVHSLVGRDGSIVQPRKFWENTDMKWDQENDNRSSENCSTDKWDKRALVNTHFPDNPTHTGPALLENPRE